MSVSALTPSRTHIRGCFIPEEKLSFELGGRPELSPKNSQEEETVTVSLDCRHARVLMSRGGDGQAKGNPTASSI